MAQVCQRIWFVQTETSPEVQSSSLMSQNLCFEIHRWQLSKSKSFSNVLVTAQLLAPSCSQACELSLGLCACMQRFCVWMQCPTPYTLLSAGQVMITAELPEEPVPFSFRNSFSPGHFASGQCLKVLTYHEVTDQYAVMVLPMLKHLAGRIMQEFLSSKSFRQKKN